MKNTNINKKAAVYTSLISFIFVVFVLSKSPILNSFSANHIAKFISFTLLILPTGGLITSYAIFITFFTIKGEKYANFYNFIAGDLIISCSLSALLSFDLSELNVILIITGTFTLLYHAFNKISNIVNANTNSSTDSNEQSNRDNKSNQ